MPMKCELTGKSFLSGNNVSHAKNRTKRRFLPNLQNISFLSEKLGRSFQLRVATSTIRTVEKKGGLDQFLINTSNNKLPTKAIRLKKQILSISAHGIIDKRRIINSKADLIFLSPIFRTSSHPYSRPLGIIKFGLIARQFSKPVIALGGINKNNIKKLKNLPIEGVAGIDFLK